MPKIFNLRTDPYERADITSNTYYDWLIDHVFLLVPAQDYVGKFLMTFKEYPQRQKAASFNLDEVMQKLRRAAGASNDCLTRRPGYFSAGSLQFHSSRRSNSALHPCDRHVLPCLQSPFLWLPSIRPGGGSKATRRTDFDRHLN